MAIVTPPTTGGLLRVDQVVREVYLGGVRRTDAEVRQVTLSAGLSPTSCTVRFPRLYAHEVGATPGVTCEVWLNRERYPVPVFRGVVVMVQQAHEERASLSLVVARDVRGALDDGVCTRHYNELFFGQRLENLRLRAIAQDIVAQANAHQAAQGVPAAYRLQVNTASLPDRPVGQFLVRGEPWGSALQRLLDEWGRGRYRLAVEYGSQSSTLFAFVPGQGALQETRLATERGEYIDEQPWGVANVGTGATEVNHAQVVNELVLESTDVVFEARVTLTENWPSLSGVDFESLLQRAAEAQLYPMPNGIAPPAGDWSMASVGRYYRIPEVQDLDNVTRRLPVAEGLVQPQAYPSGPWTKVPDAPFLAYQDDTGRWVARWDGFSIQGQDLILDEPWYRVARTTATRDVPLSLTVPVRLTDGGTPKWYYAAQVQGFDPLAAVVTEDIGSGGEIAVVTTVLSPLPGAGSFQQLDHIWATASVLPGESEVAYDASRGLLLAPVQAVYWARVTGQTLLRRQPWGTLYLNAGWVSRTRLSGTSGKLGPGALHVRRLATVEGYRKRVLRDHLRVDDSVVTVGLPLLLGTLVPVSGDTVVEDDSTQLAEIATARVRATMEPQTIISRTLPRGELGYKIGEQLTENGVATGCNIVEVTVDVEAMVTTLVATNQ